MIKPSKINYKKSSRQLILSYQEGNYELSAEFLRVHSPSAEVRGHGTQEEILQIEKQNVEITNIEPIGNYALKFTFDDGHDSGLYTWEYLKELCLNQDTYWADYLRKLKQSGNERKPKAFFKSK